MGVLGDMLFLFGVFQSSVWIISVSGKYAYVVDVHLDVENLTGAV